LSCGDQDLIMGREPGPADAFEWLGLSWADRWLTEIGATQPALATVHRLAAVDDLRTVDLVEEALRHGLMRSFLLHALLVRGDSVDLTPFVDGVPLGPLATIGVYSSDARQWEASSQWTSRPHGPSCQHHKNLRGDDDLLALGEWVKQLSTATGSRSGSRESGVCSRCGGFAIRRLTVAELRYWRAAHEVYQVAKAVEEYEQHLAGTPEPGRELTRGDRARALRTLTDVGVVLDSYLDSYDDDPALPEYVSELRIRHEALARRAGVRL
jgi:hypothetical protein